MYFFLSKSNGGKWRGKVPAEGCSSWRGLGWVWAELFWWEQLLLLLFTGGRRVRKKLWRYREKKGERIIIHEPFSTLAKTVLLEKVLNFFHASHFLNESPHKYTPIYSAIAISLGSIMCLQDGIHLKAAKLIFENITIKLCGNGDDYNEQWRWI